MKPKQQIRRCREEGDDFVFLSPVGRIVRVNKVGKFILDQCNGRNTLEDIEDEVQNYYGEHSLKVLTDVKVFIEKLACTGIIKKCD